MTNEFKVYKPGEFTVMPNSHLRDKKLSLKAKGLLSVMLDLPQNWDYSLNGLVAICKESYETVRNILKELKRADYIEILQLHDAKGNFMYKYLIFTNPSQKALEMAKNPDPKKPYMDKPEMVSSYQSNNNKVIDKKDKIDKTYQPIEHSIFTKELIHQKYITQDDVSSFYFDDLFNEYLEANYSYGDIFHLINYVVTKVKLRNFKDENGNPIQNKYLYLKRSMESNVGKLNNLPNELYPENPNDPFWNDYKNMLKDRER